MKWLKNIIAKLRISDHELELIREFRSFLPGEILVKLPKRKHTSYQIIKGYILNPRDMTFTQARYSSLGRKTKYITKKDRKFNKLLKELEAEGKILVWNNKQRHKEIIEDSL